MISRFASLLLLGVFALLSGTDVMAQQSAGTTLRFIPHADLTILDPYWSGVYITRNFGYMIYDTLFSMDGEFRPQPQMVENWTVSDDKLTYVFTLRDGLKFHDGQPVRAADVVASLKRWGQRSDAYGQTLLATAAAIEAVSEKQFRIVLKRPFPVLEALGTLTSPTPFIMPERLAQTDPFTQVKEAIGSGPFKFTKETRPQGGLRQEPGLRAAPGAAELGIRRQSGKSRSRRMALYSGGTHCGAGAERRRGRFLGKRAERL